MRDLTSGRGVELALDAVGGASFAKSYRCLAPTGRLGMFGMSAASTGKTRSLLAVARALFRTPWLRFHPPALMGANKGVFGVNVGHLWEETARVREWTETLLEWVAEGSLSPVVDQRFPFDRAAEAHHYIQDRKNLGKVLLVP